MRIYRGTIELLDYVFFSTIERGKVYETGAFIHNYALAYSLGLVQGDTYRYAQQVQEPHYQQELTPLNGTIYLTPGAPLIVNHRLVQWNTLRDAYGFPNKPPSLGYPDWGFARMLRPGCRFQFYLFLNESPITTAWPAIQGLVAGSAVRVRLGKFSGKARIQLQPASRVQEQEGPFQSEAMLNWRDLESDPLACDIITASLPTRLLNRCHFKDGKFYHLHFGDDAVSLPANMQFLVRPPAAAKKSRQKR